MEPKKSIEANIEKKKFALILIGLIGTLGFVLSSFEYTQFEIKSTSDLTVENNTLQEEIIFDIPPPPPPVAPPPPPPTVTEIEVVEDDQEIEENVVVMTETDVNQAITITEITVPDEPVVEEVFDVVEEQPEFPGGVQKLYEFIGKNIQYPPMARESGVQGKVYVQFVVGKDGKIREAKVLRGIGSGCDEEALRVVKMMPSWTPGKQRGKAVSVRYNLPIVFKLQ